MMYENEDNILYVSSERIRNYYLLIREKTGKWADEW